MKNKREIFDFLAFWYSKYLLKKSFALSNFDQLYRFTQTYVGRGYYDRIALHQYEDEFKAFCGEVKSHKPKVVVEIGTKKGGSFFMWARYLTPKLLISIDLPGGIHGGGYSKKKIPFYKFFMTDHKNSKVVLIQGDSHTMQTKEKLLNILNGEKIDFLFIDGDHRYEGVKSDFDMYIDLMNKNSLIGFHDIVASDYHHNMDCYVDVFWNEIKQNYRYQEFFSKPNQFKYGLGLLYINPVI